MARDSAHKQYSFAGSIPSLSSTTRFSAPPALAMVNW